MRTHSLESMRVSLYSLRLGVSQERGTAHETVDGASRIPEVSGRQSLCGGARRRLGIPALRNAGGPNGGRPRHDSKPRRGPERHGF